MESVTDRARIANAAYGKGWQGMATMLAGGSAAIDEAIKKAEKIGVVTTADAAAAKKFNERLDENHLAWQRLALDIGTVALPALTGFMNAIERGITRMGTMSTAVKNLFGIHGPAGKDGGKSGDITDGVATPTIPPPKKKKTSRADEAFIQGYDDQKAANTKLMESLERDQKHAEAISASAAKTDQLLYDNRMLAISQFYNDKRIREKQGLDDTLENLDKQIAATKKSLKGGGLDKLVDIDVVNKKIKDLQEKKETSRLAAGDAEKANVYAEDKATKEYKNSVQELSAAYLELQGNMGAAARMRAEIQYKPLSERAAIEGDTATLNQIKQLKELSAARADANTLELQASNIQTDLTNIEARLTLQQKAGTITELGLIQEIDRARGGSVAALQKLVEEYENLAKASGDPKLLRDAETLRVKLEELKQSSHQLADKFNTLFQNAGSSAFADFIGGTKSAKDAFRAFADDVVQQINRIAAQQIAQMVFGGGSSGGGGVGGIISGFLGGSKGGGGLSSLLGGSGGGAPSFGTGELIMDSYVPLAVGTNYVPKDMLAHIHEGEAVVPKKYNVPGYGVEKTGSRMTSVVNNFVLTQQTDNRSQSQIANAAMRGIAIASRRNG